MAFVNLKLRLCRQPHDSTKSASTSDKMSPVLNNVVSRDCRVLGDLLAERCLEP